MAKIQCSKCNITGWSKCPYCRTIFLDDRILEIVEYCFEFRKEGVLFKRAGDDISNEQFLGISRQ